MEHTTLVKVLQHIRPGAQYNVRGEAIEWLDQDQTEPTENELLAGKEAIDALSYRDKRKAEYPAIGDQLDALWKGGADAAAMKAKIDAVKAKYPKPEGL